MQTVLLLENNEDLRLMLILYLRLENFQVISAENGMTGLNLAKQIKPDLIISDVNMPEMDGYGVLKALREDLATAKIPFVFLTSISDMDKCAHAMELGADDYLTKPDDLSEMKGRD